MLLGEVLKARDVHLEGGVVHEDVELAEFAHRARHYVLAELAVTDVPGDEQTAAALLLDSLLGDLRVALLGTEIGDGDIGALAGKQHGNRAADAGIAAGNDRDLVLQL